MLLLSWDLDGVLAREIDLCVDLVFVNLKVAFNRDFSLDSPHYHSILSRQHARITAEVIVHSRLFLTFSFAFLHLSFHMSRMMNQAKPNLRLRTSERPTASWSMGEPQRKLSSSTPCFTLFNCYDVLLHLLLEV